MRLTEFSVLGYGLTDLGFDSPLRLGDFNLFYGPNEAGKSLMQDALLKILLDEEAESTAPGTHDNLFGNINRVDESPEGFVRIELGDENLKLPEQGPLPGLTEETPGQGSISPADFRNVFVVRNSLLEPSSAYGTGYYGNVTERLTGLRTSTMESIRDELADLGPLTNNTLEAQLSNDAGDDKLKDRYERAGYLLEEVRELQERAENEDLFAREKELFRARQEYDHVAERLDTLEQARSAQEYRNGREDLDSFLDAREQLEDFDFVTGDRYEKWKEKRRTVEETQETIEEREGTIGEVEEELEELEEPILERERTLSRLREVQETIQDEVKPLLDRAQQLKEFLEDNEPLEFLYRWAFVLSGLALLGFLPVMFSREIPGAGFYPPVFLTLTLLFGFLFYRFLSGRGRYEGTLQSINNILSPHDLDADSLGGLESNLQTFEERLNAVEDELSRLRDERKDFESRRRTLREQVEKELQPALDAAQSEIDNLREASGVDTLKEFENRLHDKNELEETLRESENALITRFGGEDLELEERIDHWEECLRQRKGAADEMLDEEYDEQARRKLEERQKNLSEKIEALSEEREDLREELREFGDRLQEILEPSERPLPSCEDLSDLGTVAEALENYRSEVERRRDAALEAIRIFESLEADEREKIRDLFGSDSDVSRHFETVTGGNFTSVDYDPDDNAVRVRTRNDEIFETEQLSGGTYDQLYFAIRLGLGESLLRGDPGFFLLDDPFIKSDARRLDRQFDLLGEIVDAGWQVLYFSAKDEVLDRVEAMEDRSIFRKGEHF